jgi:hypothetical protein
LKNMKLYAQKGLKSILAQVNKPTCERNWIILQMKYIMYVFSHGCVMLKYESLYELFKSLGVLNNPSMHWFDTII